MASNDIRQATSQEEPALTSARLYLGRRRHWYQPGAFCRRVCTKAGTDISHSLYGKGAGTYISHSLSGKAAGIDISHSLSAEGAGTTISHSISGTGTGTDISSVLSDGEQLQEQALTVARTHFLKGAGTENSQPLFREKQGKEQHWYHPFSFYERSRPRFQPESISAEEQAHKQARFKGTQEWEFFWLRFWILNYFIVSYVKILRFCKKKLFDWASFGGGTIFPRSPRTMRNEQKFWARSKNIFLFFYLWTFYMS